MLRARFDPSIVPAELRERDQWVLWRYEWRKDKWTKVPRSAQTHRRASSTDPQTWSSFQHVLDAWLKSDCYDGIGYVFSGDDPYCGIDLDDCMTALGALSPSAQQIVRDFKTYVEVSPSGRGVKLIARASKNGETRCASPAIDGVGKIEIYDRRRFFTITGSRLEGTQPTIGGAQPQLDSLFARLWHEERAKKRNAPESPAQVCVDDDELIRRAGEAKDGDLFKSLWAGETTKYDGDDSRADLALCGLLAFWTGGDTARVDRLFRRSSLMRPKWDERHSGDGRTYGQMTIDKALEGRTEFYTPPRKAKVNQAKVEQSALEGPCGVRLIPTRVSQTPTRCTAAFAVRVDGVDTGMELSATDTTAGKKNAVKDLAEIVCQAKRVEALDPAEAKQIDHWLRTILTSKRLGALAEDQRRRLTESQANCAVSTAPSMLDLAIVQTMEDLQLAFVDDEGNAWSERLGRFITRYEFVQRPDPKLLVKIQTACDYAAPTDADPTKPIRHVQLVLKSVWPAITDSLPREISATGLGSDSKAAEALRRHIVDLWQTPETWFKREGTLKEPGHAERMSLASRVRTMTKEAQPKKGPWQRVLGGVDAFSRVDDGRAVRLQLAGRCRAGMAAARR